MLYLGLDIHCKWFTASGFEQTTGECFKLKRVENDPSAIAAAFAALPTPRSGVMEAGTHAFALHRRLAPYFARLIVVSPNAICRVLQTIPSVGPFTALVLRAEIGDIRRFKSADALLNYSGLTPRVFQSGERVRYGTLTKAGNALLRYVAVLFAQNVIRNRQDTPFKRKYYRLCHRHGPNELKVMLARDFLATVHGMWRGQTARR